MTVRADSYLIKGLTMQNLSRKTLSLGLAALSAIAFALPVAAADTVANPCAAKPMNPCAANPCAPVKHKLKHKGKMKAANPCAAKPMNPCAAKPTNPCAANPCAAKK
jgi:hypothetical protein